MPAPEKRGVGVSLKGVRQVFEGGVVALDGVDLRVGAGEFLALLGPSGCGKSTLLRLVAGLDRPVAGEVHTERGNLAYVFQDPHLMPWRTLLGNVVLPLELRGVPTGEREAVGRAALADVGLTGWEARYPGELSGGMRMRASLARALVVRPRLLLLDEPFAALDELTRLRLDGQLHALWRRDGMTVLFVTHSISEAVLLAERVVLFSPRPARVLSEMQVSGRLPEERDHALRATAAFGELTGQLLRELERAGA